MLCHAGLCIDHRAKAVILAPAGAHRLQWDAANGRGARVAPGTYLVRLATPYGSSTKPVVIQ